ncbi:Putative DNase, TatD family protein [Giardia duodenalis]|uniref:Putative DNase, TatD family protein n=1 Tax=Giardia intestinalis TaxID=5741 RepID=V6T889_GIAIN|nr:Putative DNase, TatD family protein [Giardia intestinalis]
MIDIGANLLDDVYSGVYNGSQKHRRDLGDVLERARVYGVQHMIVTCGNLEEYNAAATLMDKWPLLSCTIGYHPTRAAELVTEDLSPKSSLEVLKQLVCGGNLPVYVRAYGELGLDYARLHFAGKEIQKLAFRLQLDIFSKQPSLPLFLHCRDAGTDFLEILVDYKQKEPRLKGVVHSFDGDLDLCNRILTLGFDIGINGCSLKTADNLSVVRNIPLSRIHLETDCPWCEIKPTHASYSHLSRLTKEHFRQVVKSCNYDKKCGDCALQCPCFVKGRTEPAHINAVAEVLAAITTHPFENCSPNPLSLSEKTSVVRRITAENSRRLFNLEDVVTPAYNNVLE